MGTQDAVQTGEAPDSRERRSEPPVPSPNELEASLPDELVANDQSGVDPAAARLAALGLLALAGVSFVAPTVLGLLLVWQDGNTVPDVLRIMVPFFQNVDEGPFSFVREYWTAIPALMGGVLIARPKSRRVATMSVLAIMLFVVVGGSLALQLQPSASILSAIAVGLSGSADSNLGSLMEIYSQIEKTREIAIPFFTGLAGAAIAVRSGK